MSDNHMRDPLGNIPRYALYRGRRVRVVDYRPGERRPFIILNRHDQKIDVAREQLTFLKEKK